jgi:hypothetical protein
MAGYEHKAQEIVAKVIVEAGVEIRHTPLLCLEFAAKFFMLVDKPFSTQ